MERLISSDARARKSSFCVFGESESFGLERQQQQGQQKQMSATKRIINTAATTIPTMMGIENITPTAAAALSEGVKVEAGAEVLGATEVLF